MKLIRFVAPLALGLTLAASAFAATPVNVNKADASTLAKSLDGVGQVKAERIVEYRKKHGAFHNAAELAKVKGIGARTVELNRDAILVKGKPSPDTGK